MAKKALLWSDSPTAITGFGGITRNVAKALHDAGWQVDIVGINYWGDPAQAAEFPDYKIWPASVEAGPGGGVNPQGDPHGAAHAGRRFWSGEYDVIWIQNDLMVADQRKEIFTTPPPESPDAVRPRTKLIYYYPIDCPFCHSDWFGFLPMVDLVVPYNEFAANMTTALFPDTRARMEIMPVGMEESSFKAVPEEGVEVFRQEALGVDADTFVIGQVSRNQVRKNNADLLLAFRMFKEQNPDAKAMLYLHMHPVDAGPSLLMIPAQLQLQVGKGKDVFWPDGHNTNKGDDAKRLNLIYNSLDCYITATMGEGWGMPIVEAMATATPVIAPNHSSITEILNVTEEGDGLRGWPVQAGGVPQLMAHVDGSGFRPRPNLQDMVTRIEEVYAAWQDKRNGKESAELDTYQARLDSAQAYAESLHWSTLGPKWVELFERVVADAPLQIHRTQDAPAGGGETAAVGAGSDLHIEKPAEGNLVEAGKTGG